MKEVWITMKFKRVDQVAAWRLCMGCGACNWACPNNAITLQDIVDHGIRPFVDEFKCEKCGDCLKVCPGIGLCHEPFSEETIEELRKGWGPVLHVKEGYASDKEIRYAGSSGGVATSLALYGLKSGIACGVLHSGPDKEEPIKNIPVYSRTKEQLLACTGSRYSPAAPCQAFGIMKKENGKSIFIGKPCDIAALNKARKLDSELDCKVALTISIFCAGTPTTKGTLALLESMGVSNIKDIENIRYRGNGWPGNVRVKLKGQDCNYEMPYIQAWGDVLTKYGQLRCRLCPDSTGEFADISCGDPWYRDISPDEMGHSLVLARTDNGRSFIGSASDASFVELKQIAPGRVMQSQRSLMGKRRQLWGRIFVMRLFGVPVPKFSFFALYPNWYQLSLKEKLRTIAGTVRRIIQRKWRKPEIIK